MTDLFLPDSHERQHVIIFHRAPQQRRELLLGQRRRKKSEKERRRARSKYYNNVMEPEFPRLLTKIDNQRKKLWKPAKHDFLISHCSGHLLMTSIHGPSIHTQKMVFITIYQLFLEAESA